MFGSKKMNRYNAYMKRTKSGIIVKTVDSETGFESLIKFTSDSLMLPTETFGDKCATEFVRPIMKKSNEGSPRVNRKQYSLIKSNPKIISKLSHLTPYLRELQPKIPGFSVYEDSSSASEFQNPNVIFVANSKLAKDNVVSLSVPGKLRNVCYQGVLNENGLVTFKAESVIKPLTIVVGDYVININICHDLPSAKDIGDQKEMQNDDASLSHCRSKSCKLSNKDKCTGIRESYIDSTTNDTNYSKFSQDCSDETVVIPESSGILEHRISDETLQSAPDLNNNEREAAESLGSGSESSMLTPKSCTQTECVVTRRSSDESTLEENNYVDEIIKTKSSSVVNSVVSNENDVPENNPYPSTCHIPILQNKTVKNNQQPINECLLPVSNENIFVDESNDSNLDKSSTSTHSVVNGADTNNSSVQNSLETIPLVEFGNGLICIEEKEDTKLRSGCSNISLQQIKKRLSEATTSLHELCSVIESIDNFSEKSVSNETVGKTQFKETSCDKLNNISESYEIINGSSNTSNPSTNAEYCPSVNSKSDDRYPSNESSANICYTEGTNQLQKKKTVSHVSMCENAIQFKPANCPNEAAEDLSTYLTESLSESNTFGKIDGIYSVTRTTTEQKTNDIIKGSSKKILFHSKRKAKSLTNLSESKKPSIDNIYKTGVNCNYLTKMNPNVLCITKHQNDLQKCEPNRAAIVASNQNDFLSKLNGGSMKFPLKSHNDNKSCISGERAYTTCMRCKQELQSETNLGQDSQISDPRMNSYSINSIRTIYIKSDCASSNYLTMPVQNSSMKMINPSKAPNMELSPNNLSISNPKCISDEKLNKSSYKSLGKKIKHNLTRLRKELWDFGTLKSSKKEISDLTQSPVHSESKVLGTVAEANNVMAENEEQLVCITAENESLRYLNFDHDARENHRVNNSQTDQGSSNTIPDSALHTLPSLSSSQNISNKGVLINPKTVYTHPIIDPTTVDQNFQMSYTGGDINP